jgi:hypothetical protein
MSVDDLDADGREIWERLLEMLKAAEEAGERAQRDTEDRAAELGRLLDHYAETLEPPSDGELLFALGGRWPLGITAVLMTVDGLEAQITVGCPPPRMWHNPLPQPLGAAMLLDSSPPSSAPELPTRDYELRKFDPRLGAAIYIEVLR